MKTLSFIIPVYNEEKRIHKTFAALQELQLPRGLKLLEIIFVDDGSTDNTKKMITAYAKSATISKKINIISYSINRGKGYALRQGMQQAISDYALFFDADISTPLSEINKFNYFINSHVDVIIGTRKNGHSTVTVHQPFIREVLGKAFTKLTQLALSVNNTDFTCGFKSFSKEARHTIFSKSQIDRWGYDAEILFLAKKYHFSEKEVPVAWADDKNTRVKLGSAIVSTLMELTKLVWLHRTKPWLSNIAPTPLLSLANLIK